jgi:predicted ATPase
MAMATVMRGGAMVEREEPQEGIEQLRRGLAAYRATRTEAGRVFGLTVLAGAYGKLRNPETALKVLDRAFKTVEETSERYYESELYRVKGELLLMQDPSNTAQAQGCFQRAIEVARKQGAKSLELRATTSLASLLIKQGYRQEARAMLAEIYGWFTEGFDPPDLKEARALLNELTAL